MPTLVTELERDGGRSVPSRPSAQPPGEVTVPWARVRWLESWHLLERCLFLFSDVAQSFAKSFVHFQVLPAPSRLSCRQSAGGVRRRGGVWAGRPRLALRFLPLLAIAKISSVETLLRRPCP